MSSENEKASTGNIISGVRYKRGSVKLIQKNGEFVIEIRKYLIFRVPFSLRRKTFFKIEDAQYEYDRIQSYLYKLS